MGGNIHSGDTRWGEKDADRFVGALLPSATNASNDQPNRGGKGSQVSRTDSNARDAPSPDQRASTILLRAPSASTLPKHGTGKLPPKKRWDNLRREGNRKGDVSAVVNPESVTKGTGRCQEHSLGQNRPANQNQNPFPAKRLKLSQSTTAKRPASRAPKQQQKKQITAAERKESVLLESAEQLPSIDWRRLQASIAMPMVTRKSGGRKSASSHGEPSRSQAKEPAKQKPAGDRRQGDRTLAHGSQCGIGNRGNQQPATANPNGSSRVCSRNVRSITAQEMAANIPDDATSIFHIMDRRINVDNLSPDAGLYELLRLWVQDDPHRQRPLSSELSESVLAANVAQQYQNAARASERNHALREASSVADDQRLNAGRAFRRNPASREELSEMVDRAKLAKSRYVRRRSRARNAARARLRSLGIDLKCDPRQP